MDFRVLGPLEVVDGPDGRVPAGVKERTILARLLLTPGRPVSGERLIEAAWPESGRAAAVRYFFATAGVDVSVDREPDTIDCGGWLLDRAAVDIDAEASITGCAEIVS